MLRHDLAETKSVRESTISAIQEQPRGTRLRSSSAAMTFPVRLLRGRWPGRLERILSRFCWQDPSVVQDDAASAESFRTAMSAFWFEGTYKITGAGRHPVADELLADHVEGLAEAHILDIGASDGSTSLDLINRLPAFGRYTISDRFIEASTVEHRGRTFFFDPEQRCCLIVGRRFILWPTMSRLVSFLSRSLRRAADPRSAAARPVVLLNPEVRQLLRDDPRVSWQEHDIFRTWTGWPADVVKVANLLRRLYFDDATIRRALRNLLAGMPEGAHLLIADNSRVPGMGPRAGVYRRGVDRFEVVAETKDVPEISDLVTAVTMSATGSPSANTVSREALHDAAS